MSRRMLVGIIAVSAFAITVVVAMTALSPAPTPEISKPGPPAGAMLEPAVVTTDCTDLSPTSLRAHADIIDDGGDWVTRRGFQYAVGGTGDLPDMIVLVNASFEYGTVPTGWTGWDGSLVRSAEQVKEGDFAGRLTQNVPEARVFVGQSLPNLPHHRGKTITLGVWVWCDTSERVRIAVADRTDGAGWEVTVSSCHPGDSEWHFLTVTRTIRTDAEDSWVQALRIDGGASVVSGCADGAIVVEGSESLTVFEDGEFGTGTYSSTIAGLKPDTSYRVRAFAENEGGVEYGNMVICKTQE